MKQTVKISCQGAAVIAVNDLTPFQGNLKDLSEESYKKLRKEILELGFSEPVCVWKHDGKNLVLNGHQRVRTLTRMVEEGIEVPPIPVTIVDADNVREAKKKILALTSQYGNMTGQGLYEFMHEAELSLAEIEESFKFPEINLDLFKAEFFQDAGGGAQSEITGSKELSASDFETFAHACPRCGFEFDSSKKEREPRESDAE